MHAGLLGHTARYICLHSGQSDFLGSLITHAGYIARYIYLHPCKHAGQSAFHGSFIIHDRICMLQGVHLLVPMQDRIVTSTLRGSFTCKNGNNVITLLRTSIMETVKILLLLCCTGADIIEAAVNVDNGM